ncbi:hypothetical protein AB0K60_12370 [Thermopolyspora sp. NPDC052614]|uniref:hypothetical protein n=1 Tax=Thermopolyspora sp. NPDC052614 TaxID=3155682 RepID=UPI00343BC6E9
MLTPYNRAGILALAAALTSGIVISLSGGAGAETAGHEQRKAGSDTASCIRTHGKRDAECPGDNAPERACLSPEGINLNQLYRVKERIIGPPACRTALAGERWVRVTPEWVTAADADTAVYPKGYVPEKPNPIDDFNAKLVAVRYVQDIGTPRERSFTFGRKAVLRTGFFTEDGLPYSTTVSPSFRPLSVGTHTSTVYYRLRAKHCDGLGTDRVVNCLPAGETVFSEAEFEVVPRRR